MSTLSTAWRHAAPTPLQPLAHSVGAPEWATLVVNGTDGDDVLSGTSSADTLDGGLGADTLSGGKGGDTYVVDNTGDVVNELSGGGLDTVQSSVSWTLGVNVEYLTLTGLDAVDGTGNSLSNLLQGNDAANWLQGLGGNDTLLGGGGNDTLDGGTGTDSLTGGTGDDTYGVDRTTDVVVEHAGEGVDTVLSSVNWTLGDAVENLTLTGTASRSATGNSGDNLITGNTGNNTLDGAAGVDTLAGGAGNDTYLIDSDTDLLIEAAGGGTDTVVSSVSYTLGADFENLTLTGAVNLNGTGNSLNNVLTGNDGANLLTGGAGNDTYVVNTLADTIIELAKEGTDTVKSSVSWTLGANLEKLVLTGTDNLSGVGNTLNNTITANIGNNYLDGGDGNDVLDAATGRDTVFGGNGNDQLKGLSAGSADGGAGTDSATIASLSGYSGYANYWTVNGANFDINADFATLGSYLAAGNNYQFHDVFYGRNLTLSSVENLSVQAGSAGHDLIFAVGNGTTFDGGAGFDAFYADWSAQTSAVTWNETGGASATATATNFERLMLTSGSGDDVITGLSLSGNSVIHTGAGADTVTVSVASIDAGADDDTLSFAYGAANGGTGNDTLTLTSLSGYSGYANYWTINGGNFDVNADFATLASYYASGNNFTFHDVFYGHDTSLSNIENINVLSGSVGHDLVFAHGNGTTYDGSAGFDAFYADWSAQTSAVTWNESGGASATATASNFERLMLTSGSGDDVITGLSLSGNSVIHTGAGADTVTVSVASIDAGADDDTLSFAYGAANGGTGNDTLTLTSLSGYSGYANYWTINGGNFDVNADFATLASYYASGNNFTFHDVFYGHDTSLSNIENINVLSGSVGHDLVFAHGNGTTYDGSAGFDAFYADWSAQTSAVTWNETGGASATATATNFERLMLTSGSGDDVITGLSLSGNSVIHTGAGADTVTVSVASIDAGADDDTLSFAYGAANGGTGNDTLTLTSLSGYSGYANYWTINGGNFDVNADFATLASYYASGNNFTFHDVFYGHDTSLSNIENINVLSGSAGHDLVFAHGNGTTYEGGAGFDALFADWSARGDDIVLANDSNSAAAAGQITGFERLMITTGAGNDLLDNTGSTTAASDVLRTGAGHDTLAGGAGYDTLTGGSDADTFVFNSLVGSDLITDFSSGVDHFSVSASLLPIGNGDLTLDSAAYKSGAYQAGGFLASDELVILTDAIGSLDTSTVAAALSQAGTYELAGDSTIYFQPSSYASGDTALFVASNGSSTGVYYFQSSGNDNVISASELTLLATLAGTPTTTVGDYIFGG